MGEVSIEGTVLVVTPVQRANQIMIQLTVGDPVRSPVIGPSSADQQITGLTVAVEKSLSQIPFLQQQAGTQRLTIILTEEEYDSLGRPRYPDKILVNLALT